MPVTDVRKLSDFEGEWDITRHVTPVHGPTADFEGKAIWSPASGGLAYKEHGLMTLVGHPPMQAERRYFWAQDLSVSFEDGRFFHHVPPAGGKAHHWCPPDNYTIIYDFSDWPRFTVHWQVHGPRKDYAAMTEYDRC